MPFSKTLPGTRLSLVAGQCKVSGLRAYQKVCKAKTECGWSPSAQRQPSSICLAHTCSPGSQRGHGGWAVIPDLPNQSRAFLSLEEQVHWQWAFPVLSSRKRQLDDTVPEQT